MKKHIVGFSHIIHSKFNIAVIISGYYETIKFNDGYAFNYKSISPDTDDFANMIWDDIDEKT